PITVGESAYVGTGSVLTMENTQLWPLHPANVSTRRDDHFVLFCSAVGRPDLAQSGLYTTTAMRVARKAELVPQLRDAMRRLTTAELTRRLDEAGILNSVVNSYATMAQDQHVKATQAVAWRSFDGFDGPLPICNPPGATLEAAIAPPPHIGEHSLQVLRDWGVGDAAIQGLLDAGAVFEPGLGA
ncbi:MAG: CoA transferase, partial [Pseudomonadota bacterium]